jgi:SAM-dependent methyltransferase
VRHSNAILDFQRKRSKTSAAFFVPFLNDAMEILDMGCGPGTITTALARVAKRAIGIDINAHAIAAARQTASHVQNVSFVTGTMTELPFDDKRFDAVFFHAVLYHLDAITLASTLSEARRVLKPGGLIVTRDADVGGNILYPETEALLLALDLWVRWYEHSDPDAERFGRQSATLRAHGFMPVWSGASHVNHSADVETRRETVIDARKSLLGLKDELIARHLATADELKRAIDAWNEWGDNADSIYLRCRCECVARKVPGRHASHSFF